VQKRKISTQTNIFLHHPSSTFSEFSSNLLLEYRRKNSTEAGELMNINHWSAITAFVEDMSIRR